MLFDRGDVVQLFLGPECARGLPVLIEGGGTLFLTLCFVRVSGKEYEYAVGGGRQRAPTIKVFLS